MLLNPHRFASSVPSQISCLLHGEGAQGGAVFTDSSTFNHAFARTGVDAYTDNTNFKWGTHSIIISAASYISGPEHVMFGFEAGDYTVEGWFRGGSSAVDKVLFDNRTAAKEGIAIYSSLSSAANCLAIANNAAVIATSATAFSNNVSFHFFQVKRAAGVVKGFLDGVEVFSVADARTYAASSKAFIGANYLGGQTNAGWFDDIRVSKGIAQSSVVPTGPFPNP